jgi:glycosyltransferase involved in cell wall biosynthesis
MVAQRILYVDLAPAVGGSIISLYQLVKGLAGEPYEPHVVLRTGNPYQQRFRDLGVPVSTVGAAGNPSRARDSAAVSAVRGARAVRWLKQSRVGREIVHRVGFYARQYPTVRREANEIGAIIRAWQPQLVHLNDILAVTRPAALAARRHGVPAICHLRAMDARTPYDRRLSRSLRGYICISRAVDAHQRSLGGRTDPAWIVYNGVDLAEIDQPVNVDALRSELGLCGDEQVVGSIGRLVAWKGQDVFVRALAALAPKRPQLRGLIVGAPDGPGDAYVRSLHALADSLGIAERVIWTGYRADVPRLLRALSVLVHSARDPEPFGRVLIEAMAAGVVTIGARAGAVPEIITDGVDGLTTPPGDVKALAAAIARALDDAVAAEAWRRAARSTVEQRFSLQAYVQSVTRVYQEILN